MRFVLFLCFLRFSLYGQTAYIPDAEVRKAIANTLWDEVNSETPTAVATMMEWLIKNDEVFKLYEITFSRLKIELYEINSVNGFVKDI